MTPDEEALARTALLIRLDALDGKAGDDAAIVAGLRASTVRIHSDRANLASPAGQTALVTLHNQLVMCGLRVELDCPDVQLCAPQPPLTGLHLHDALADYRSDLMPGGSEPDGSPPVLSISIGDTQARTDLRLTGSRAGFRVAADEARGAVKWAGSNPFGALAGASSAAAEAVRAAMPNVLARLGRSVQVPPAWLHDPARVASQDLAALRTASGADLEFGSLDFISGGAITQACIYALLRVPGLRASMQVFEPEALDLTNLNRYALSRRSDCTTMKTSILERLATPDVSITGRPVRFEASADRQLAAPLAHVVAVGVDHIPSRWAVQREAMQSHITIGASSHDLVVVSSHPPGYPCGGCTHPLDDPGRGAIPTIGFVSLWAGLLQAHRLLDRPLDHTQTVLAWPLGMDGARGLMSYAQAAASNCPVACPSSAA